MTQGEEKPLYGRAAWWRRWLYAAGIHVPAEKIWSVHLRPRFFALLGSAFLAAVVVLAGLAKYSESPRFCRSCHIMEPYYNAWATSKHKFVACVECHYPPGSPRTLLWKKFQALSQVAKYVTRTYSSKPFAEIEDSSCLRPGCHSTRLLQGKVISEKGIHFDHTPHLLGVRRGRRLRCVSCHSQIVVGKHVEVTWDTCYLCHFMGTKSGRELKPVAGCLGCHELPKKSFMIGNITYNHKAFVTQKGVSCQNCHLNVIQGSGEATQDRCYTCHNQPEKLAKFSDTAFIHENHVTKHNVACFHCHKEMKHGFTEANHQTPHESLPLDCSKCHLEMHQVQAAFYAGKAGGRKEAMPSPMYLANVDCVGCHLHSQTGRTHSEKTYKATEAGCIKCHGEKYRGIVADSKQLIAETLQELEENLALAQTALAIKEKESGKAPLKEARKNLAQAAEKMTLIKEAHAVHNIYLAAGLLRESDQEIARAGKKLDASLQDLSERPLISGGFCATLCHSKVGVKVPPVTVRHQGKSMPHLEHTQLLSCTACHDFGRHKSVKFKGDAVCRTCHAP